MKKRTLLLLAAALMLTMLSSLGTALAYFTSSAYAKGDLPIELGTRTEIEEDFSAWIKHVNITADATAQPAFIRVKAFAGRDFTLQISDPSGLWTEGSDGYWYYGPILEPGETAGELLIKILNAPVAPQDGDGFNVIVVQEGTSVRYREDGTPYADWNAAYTGGVQG